MLKTHFGGLRRIKTLSVCALAVGLSLGLTACDDDDDNAAEARALTPMSLASADDVARAVAAVWVGVAPLIDESAPQRPEPADAPETGTVEEDCTDGGRIVYDQDAQTTSFEDCRTVTESEPDADTGESTIFTVVENGLIDENCLSESQSTADRCLNQGTDSAFQDERRSEADAEPMLVRSGNLRVDSAMEINESDSGYVTFTDQRLRVDFTEDDARSEIDLQYIDMRLELAQVGTEEEPAFGVHLDGELSASSTDSSLCNAGDVRFGTVDALQVDPSAGTAPTGGTLIVSTSEIGALRVRFAADSSIEFELAGEMISVPAADIDGLCLASYTAGDADGGDDGDGDGGDDLCLPGSSVLCLPI